MVTSKQPNGGTRESWRKDKTRSGENKPGPRKINQVRRKYYKVRNIKRHGELRTEQGQW